MHQQPPETLHPPNCGALRPSRVAPACGDVGLPMWRPRPCAEELSTRELPFGATLRRSQPPWPWSPHLVAARSRSETSPMICTVVLHPGPLPHQASSSTPEFVPAARREATRQRTCNSCAAVEGGASFKAEASALVTVAPMLSRGMDWCQRHSLRRSAYAKRRHRSGGPGRGKCPPKTGRPRRHGRRRGDRTRAGGIPLRHRRNGVEAPRRPTVFTNVSATSRWLPTPTESPMAKQP